MIKPGESWPFDLTRPSEPGEETYGKDNDPSYMPARLRDLTGKQQTMIRAYVAGRTMARAVYMYLPPAEATRIMELVEALCKREIDALIAPYDPEMIRAVDAEEERERAGAAARAAAASEAAKIEAARLREPPTAANVSHAARAGAAHPSRAIAHCVSGEYIGTIPVINGPKVQDVYRDADDMVTIVGESGSSINAASTFDTHRDRYPIALIGLLITHGVIPGRHPNDRRKERKDPTARVEHAPPRLRRSLGFIVKDKAGFPLDGRVFDSYEAAYQYAEALHGAERVRMYFDIVERSPI